MYQDFASCRQPAELSLQGLRMGRVQHDELVDHLRPQCGERPGNRTAPVVPDHHRTRFTSVLDEGSNVVDEVLDAVAPDA